MVGGHLIAGGSMVLEMQNCVYQKKIYSFGVCFQMVVGLFF